MDGSELTARVLPYHEALAHYLRTEEAETWAWFASAEPRTEDAEALRLELLKETYRLDPAAYPEVLAAAADAKARLGLDVPVTLYQSQRALQTNAALIYLPGEAHIVLEGGLLQLLTPAELRALLGHELAHYRLWSDKSRPMLLLDRTIHAMAADARAEPSHLESARLMRLYTEIFADRGALQVARDPAVAISSLVKILTGLAQVDVASYVRQAEEIFAKTKVNAGQPSHPEAFIRARAIMLHAENAPDLDAEITRMIEGELTLDRLDLLGQQRLAALTRRWVRRYLRPAWFQTDPVRGQARLLFPDFIFPTEGERDDALRDDLRDVDTGVRDYLCYLLLDFAAADPELEWEPLREGFALTRELGWDDRFETLVVKELKLKKREAQRLRAGAGEPQENADTGQRLRSSDAEERDE